MQQSWFEMKDVLPRKWDSSVWIPLRSTQELIKEGKPGHLGYTQEYFGCNSIMFAIDKKTEAENFEWTDVGIGHHHAPYRNSNDQYVSADIFEKGDGIFLVLTQGEIDVTEWHLHQDLVIALGLQREGDVWLRPSEGYVEVARLKRGDEGEPILLEIRSEQLKDYLCARKMALYISSFRNRDEIVLENPKINWSPEMASLDQNKKTEMWEGYVTEIHEGGQPYGSQAAVMHISRTDIDPEEDIPQMDLPSDDDTVVKSWTHSYKGQKLYRISGEHWRNEWVDPSEKSTRVLGDNETPTVFFKTDNKGGTESRETLRDGGKWLWFKPSIAMELAHRRGGFLTWYTEETGGLGCSGYSVHFGINKLGLVTVYAKDIALLPEWQQRIWAGHNVSPDGGIAKELHDSQLKASPADTQAPEAYLMSGLKLINDLSQKKFGFSIFIDHPEHPEILSKCHRFRAIDTSGLYSLAKDLARLTADSINKEAIKKSGIVLQDKSNGSLKHLEALLASNVTPEFARRIMGPLFGVYELRLGDAHLPSKEIHKVLTSLGIDQKLPLVHQAKQLLGSCVSSVYSIAKIIE